MRLSGHNPSQGLGVPARHIQADFADDGLRHADIDAVDAGQVDTADAVQFTTQVKLRGMASGFPPPLGAEPPLSRYRVGRIALGSRAGQFVGDALQMLFERLIALGDPLLVRVVHRDFLLQHK
jgi:hypothetical protein